MENIRETLMVFDSCGDTDKERGRGKVTGWTVGVKRKLPCPGNARTDHTDIYIYIYAYVFIYVFSIYFVSFAFASLGYLAFPLRDCSPSVHCSNERASLIAAQLRHDTSHPRARLTQSDGALAHRSARLT